MKKILLIIWSLFMLITSNAQSGKTIYTSSYSYSPSHYSAGIGYSCLIGISSDSSGGKYPLTTYSVDDPDYKEDMLVLSNGKSFPILNRFVRLKKYYIGGVLEDLVVGKKTFIKDIILKPKGENTAEFTIVGADFSRTMMVSNGVLLSMDKNCSLFCDNKGSWKIYKK